MFLDESFKDNLDMNNNLLDKFNLFIISTNGEHGCVIY